MSDSIFAVNGSRAVKLGIFPLCLALAALGCLGPMSSHAATLTYKDLVKRLTNMEQLAVLPPSGERGALASSYNRASKYDAAAGKYVDWDMNNDGDGIIRTEDGLLVLAEMKGPGCIWRIWSAKIGAGRVKIYLDGAETPAVDLPTSAYFDGKTEPFTRPNLVYETASKGVNNYTPIPFQHSCKIVAEKNWGRYYHFNYSVFPEGTVVPTFKLPLAAADAAALDEANRIMGRCGADPAGSRPGQRTESRTVTAPAGGKAVVADLKGPRAITGLKVKLELPKDAEAQRTLLAQLTLKMTWDDESAPAVWSPLGDFFAAAAGAAPFQTLPVGLSADGQFYCYWYMPFSAKARLEVGNDTAQPVPMTWEITHAPLDLPIGQLGRFHAKWHRDAFLPERKDRAIDWTLLTTAGKGRYVGTQMHIWNPRGMWWGEGDEKFFVDGEKFPSTYGTGMEDYFGYAWGSGNTFVQALHSQPVNENNRGHVSANRWHIADNIPFQTSFEGAMEKYFTNERGTLFSAVAFWYLSPGGKDPYPAVPVSERIGWWVRPEIYQEAGSLEGESMALVGKPLHCEREETWAYGRKVWSGDAQLLWKPARAGEMVEMNFEVKRAGTYRLLARFTNGPDFGICQVTLNGQKTGGPVDFFAPKMWAAEPVDLGSVELPAGCQTLKLEVTGKNEASSGYRAGLDYIKLAPEK